MDFQFLELSSQAANAAPLSSEAGTSNSHFVINYDSPISLGHADVQVALRSITINIGPQPTNALEKLDVYVMSNLCAPVVRVGNQNYPVMARIQGDQSNERVRIDLSDRMQFRDCNFKSFTRATFQLCTATFATGASESLESHTIHSPDDQNATLIELAFRPKIPAVGDFLQVGRPR